MHGQILASSMFRDGTYIHHSDLKRTVNSSDGIVLKL